MSWFKKETKEVTSTVWCVLYMKSHDWHTDIGKVVAPFNSEEAADLYASTVKVGGDFDYHAAIVTQVSPSDEPDYTTMARQKILEEQSKLFVQLENIRKVEETL